MEIKILPKSPNAFVLELHKLMTDGPPLVVEVRVSSENPFRLQIHPYHDNEMELEAEPDGIGGLTITVKENKK